MTEIKAITWLLANGFEVFRNESSTGPVDIVALDIEMDEVILIDVKTCAISVNTGNVTFSTNNKTELQKDLAVQFLFYDKVDDIFTWEKDMFK